MIALVANDLDIDVLREILTSNLIEHRGILDVSLTPVINPFSRVILDDKLYWWEILPTRKPISIEACRV